MFLETHESNPRKIAGCARVEGDEEEDGDEDLEYEFNFVGRRRDTQDMQYIAEGMLQGHMTYGRAGEADMLPQVVNTMPNVPLLTNGNMVLCDMIIFLFCFFFLLLPFRFHKFRSPSRLMIFLPSTMPWFLLFLGAEVKESTPFPLLIPLSQVGLFV